MIKLKYKDFTFDVNVKDFNISMQKNVSTVSAIDQQPESNKITVEPTVLSGKGYFIGDEALDKAYQLIMLYNDSTSDFVYSPYSVVFKAFFTKLCISYSAEKGRVEYEIEFTEELPGKNVRRSVPFTFVEENENAFDLAERVNIPIEKIIKLNDLQDLFKIGKGSKIWLM